VDLTGSRGKRGEVQLSHVGGEHEGAVRVTDGDGIDGDPLVEDGGIDSTKVGGAAGVGNGGGGGQVRRELGK
jgi:hypothetical protein